MPDDDIVYFHAATVFARKIELGKKLVILNNTHRGSSAACDDGYLVIEQHWYPMKKKK